MQILQITRRITIIQITNKIKASKIYKRYYPGPTQHICNPNMLNAVLRNNTLYESTPFARHCQTILYNKTHIGTLSYNDSQRYMPIDVTKRDTDFREIKEFKPHNFRPKQIMGEKKLDLILERMKELSFKDPNKMIDYLLKEISVNGSMHPIILQELIISLEQKNSDPVTEKQHLLLSVLKQYFATLPQGDIKNIKINRCFTYQDRIEKRDSCQRILDILQNENHKLYTQKEQINLWVESGIIVYPDVYYKHYDGAIYKYLASEGLKVKYKAYELMRENSEFFTDIAKNSSPPSDDLMEYFLTQIKNKNYEAGLLKRDIIEQILKGENIQQSQEPIVLSGQDLHVVLTFKDPKDSKYLYVWGMFTSSTDDTIQLSKTQEFNRLSCDMERPQCVRINKKLIRIKESDFQQHAHASRYSTRPSKEGSDIPLILFQGVQKNMHYIKNNPIEEPFDFTTDNLNMLAKLYLQAQIQKLNLENERIDKLDSEERDKKIRSQEKDKAKFLQELKINQWLKSLSEQDNLLYKIKLLLEQRIKKIENDKQRKEKDEQDKKFKLKQKNEDSKKFSPNNET